MATLNLVNIGPAPDEGGDPLRTAFDKLNDNDEALNEELGKLSDIAILGGVDFLAKNQDNTIDVSAVPASGHPKTGSAWDNTYIHTFTGQAPDGLSFTFVNNSGHGQIILNDGSDPLFGGTPDNPLDDFFDDFTVPSNSWIQFAKRPDSKLTEIARGSLDLTPPLSSFEDLTDTPSDYSGHGNKFVRVTGGEDGLEFVNIPGGGDMLAATYDPTGVVDDAFDMDNMVEGADTKIMTAAERSKLAGAEEGATADQTPSEIETAYNSRVAEVTQNEAETGAVTSVRRWSPQRVKQAIEALAPAGGGGGAEEFLELTDTPADYAGDGSKFVAVKATEDGLEFVAAPGGGDMLASTYDPGGVAGDAFDMDNMVEGANTKILTSAERSKLAGIESNATQDQTGAEIKSLYEGEANTNAFTDAEKAAVATILQLGALTIGPDSDVTYSRATHGDMPAFWWKDDPQLTAERTLTFPFDEGVAGSICLIRVRQETNFKVDVRLEDPDNPGTYTTLPVEPGHTRIIRKNDENEWWTDFGFWENGAEVNHQFVSQAEAEAGTEGTARSWSPERVAQAIDALAVISSAADLRALRGSRSGYNVGNGDGTLTLADVHGMIDVFGAPAAPTTLTMPDGSVTNEKAELVTSETSSWAHPVSLEDTAGQGIKSLVPNVVYDLRWRGVGSNPRWNVEGFRPRQTGTVDQVVLGTGELGDVPNVANRTVKVDITGGPETVTLTKDSLSTSADYEAPSGHIVEFFGGNDATIELVAMDHDVNADGTHTQQRWGVFCDPQVTSLTLDVPSGVSIKWDGAAEGGPTTKTLDVDRFYTILLRFDDAYEIWSSDPNAGTSGGGGDVSISGTPNANEYARWTDGSTIEGRTASEVRSDLNVEDGADVTDAANVESAGAVMTTGDQLVDADANNVLTQNPKFWAGTQTDYDAIGTPNADTLYFIIAE